jgi:site-specific DNA recombinase
VARRLAVDSKLAIAYLRVSTEDQSLGPDVQRAAIVQWAAQNGVSIASWHVDQGVSGGSSVDKRPALLAAVDALRDSGAGLLVIAKRDRLARDIVVGAMIEQLVARQNGSIVSADGTGNGDGPADELMRNMVQAFAQYERALIRARTRAALSVKRERGERTGGVPYGMQLGADGKTLEENPGELAVLVQVRSWRAAGLSTRAIVGECGRAGFLARSGKPFQQTQIVRMLAKGAA